MKAFITAVLGTVFCLGLSPIEPENEPIRLLYVTGGGFHDYEGQEELLSRELSERMDLEWTTDFEAGSDNTHKLSLHDDPDWHEDFDAVIYNMCFAGVTDVDYIEGIALAHYESGTAAIFIHCAMHTYRDAETDEWDKLVGLKTYHHEHEQREFEIESLDSGHTVMENFPDEGWVSPQDELYIITHEYEDLVPLAQAYGPETEEHHVVMWLNTYGNARVAGTTAGHNNAVLEDPVFLDFLENGLRWAVEQQ